MTPSEVQAAQTPSVALIVFAFLLILLICVGKGRLAKALSNGWSWDSGGRDCRHFCRWQQRQQRHGMTSPMTGHLTTLVVARSVAMLDEGQSRQQRRWRTTQSPPRQLPQKWSRQFKSHGGVADGDGIHNDGAPDPGSRSGTAEQTQRLPGGRRYPLQICFFRAVAGQRFAGVMPDDGL